MSDRRFRVTGLDSMFRGMVYRLVEEGPFWVHLQGSLPDAPVMYFNKAVVEEVDSDASSMLRLRA